MPMATSWSHVPNDRYKSTRELIHMLIEVVAKGGNFLLNIGPGPDGEIDGDAYRRLGEIGAWMDVNGEAIYNTRPVPPYRRGKIAYTKSSDGSVNALYLSTPEDVSIPAQITIPGFRPAQGGSVTLLGSRARLRWEATPEGCRVTLPEPNTDRPPSSDAWVFRITRPAAVQQ
jgi:alpha-L-fucosidase